MKSVYLLGIILFRLTDREILQALCGATMSDDDVTRTTVLDTIGIFFLGTPHRGLEIAKVFQFYGILGKACGIASVSPMMKEIKPKSEQLQNLSTQFRQVLKKVPIQIYSCYETRPVGSFGLVITPFL